MKKWAFIFYILFISCNCGYSQGCLKGNWMVYAGRPEFSYVLELDSCNKDIIADRGVYLAQQLSKSVYITLSSSGISNLSVLYSDSLITLTPRPYYSSSITEKIVARTPIYYETYFFDYDPNSDSNGFYSFPNICSSGVKLVPDNVKYVKEKFSVQGLPIIESDISLIIWPYFWAFYYYPDYYFLEMTAVYAVYDNKKSTLIFANDITYTTKVNKILDYKTNVNNLALEIVNDIQKLSIKY